MNVPSDRVRRARPLLGTVVEIVLQGREERVLHQAANQAFAVVERVQSLMSFQCEHSDVSMLNREAARREVTVDAWTWQVLHVAAKVSAASGGTFDITIGGRMMRRGGLRGESRFPLHAQACFEDIELAGENRVRFRRPLAIDLGGIAKGYAVDLAVQRLAQVEGVSGWVNAGGDLRSFGGVKVPVFIRDPWQPQAMAARLEVLDEAVATTARYARSSFNASGSVVDPRNVRAGRGVRSASVRAPTCVLADALAKVVFLSKRGAIETLSRFASRAFILDRNGLELLETKS